MVVFLKHRSVRSILAILIALILTYPIISCGKSEKDTVQGGTDHFSQTTFTDGVSGRPPTLIGQPGQSLPLKPTRQIEFTASEGTALSLDVSPSGESIVFDMLGDIYTLGIEGGTAQAISSGMAMDTEPVFSPDGSEILFLSDRSGAENLWVIKTDGSQAQQVSFYDDNPIFVSPEWAPDGQSILVTRFWADRNAYELWQFKRSGDPLGRVLRPSHQEGIKTNSLGATYAPGGDAFYFASLNGQSPSFDEVSSWEIVRREIKTGEEAVIVNAISGDIAIPKFRPLMSPDGVTLAFAERRDTQTYLMTLDLKTQTLRTLTDLDPDFLQSSLWHDVIPRFDFTPDGLSIVVNKDGGFERISLLTEKSLSIPFKATIKQDLGKLVRHQASIDEGPVRARLIQSVVLSPDNSRIAFSALGRLFVNGLTSNAVPQMLTKNGKLGYHPSWSEDGKSIAYVTWNSVKGGSVRIMSSSGEYDHQLDLAPAFYTQPVFVPGQQAIIVVRSPLEARRTTYMEFGQFRDADLIFLPLNGGAPRVLISGHMGGRPHFEANESSVLVNFDDGVYAVSLADGDRKLVTRAVGANWYFLSTSAPADDLRVSPDGRWALALSGRQLHVYEISQAHEKEVDLSTPLVKHTKLTRAGADYFGWSVDGSLIYWSHGSSLYSTQLSDVQFSDPSQDFEVDPVENSVNMARDEPSGRMLLRGGNVISMADRAEPSKLMRNADILLNGSRIEAIYNAGVLKASPDTRVVDVSGTYIIPGLIDAHYHIADIRRDVLDFDARGLSANLAYGVTTLFDPSSLTIDMLAYQDLVDTGDITGSRVYTTGPAIFDYYDFRSIEDVRAVLRGYKNHYRLSNIKQYRSGNRRVRQWIVEVCDELQLNPTTEGALSFKLNLSQIIDGNSGAEHAVPPAIHYTDLTTLFAKSGTSNNLTLMNTHGGRPALSSLINRTNLLDSPKYSLFSSEWFRKTRKEDATPPLEQSEYLYPLVARSGLQLYKAGGIVGLGSHGEVPGLGAHWEMQAYNEGGWSPAETLWAATMGSATAIGRNQSLGSLEGGKLADLVILDSNPLDDVRNNLNIRAVMKNGRLYDGHSLKILSDTALPATENDE